MTSGNPNIIKILDVTGTGYDKEFDREYFIIEWEYSDTTLNKSIRFTTGNAKHTIEPMGRGEWVAKTMDDAKQMAIDFNEGVS